MWYRSLSIALFALSLILGWVMLDLRDFADAPLELPAEGVLYSLEPGASVGKLAADLEARGYLKNALYLRLLARWEGQAAQLKAGEYHIATGTTPRALLKQIVGGRVTRYSLTLVEGWTFSQVIEAVRQHPALTQTLHGLTDAAIMERLGYPGEHPEGRFFPDTYHFPRGMSDVAFLQRAYQTMEKTLAQEWAARDADLPLETPYQALTLASIVERESAVPQERAEIAGVFTRRLKRGMKLQTDPTVIYGLGNGFDGDLRRRDLKADTPYNTYLHRGLTPTPICMPSAEAIRAALHPATGDALYFVSRGDGTHQFSASLEAHNQAVRKYQLAN